ncbi:MAG: hypothetical protein KAX49_20170, partial [Halanaerobiales bacterium]|nr:hypothetical protein [Halanaerobiales bacterium]
TNKFLFRRKFRSLIEVSDFCGTFLGRKKEAEIELYLKGVVWRRSSDKIIPLFLNIYTIQNGNMTESLNKGVNKVERFNISPRELKGFRRK